MYSRPGSKRNSELDYDGILRDREQGSRRISRLDLRRNGERCKRRAARETANWIMT
jgi:hypothetical protein